VPDLAVLNPDVASVLAQRQVAAAIFTGDRKADLGALRLVRTAHMTCLSGFVLDVTYWGGMIICMASGARPRVGMGCLGTIVAVVLLVAVVAAVILVGFVSLGVVAVLVLIGLVVLAVDRVALALSPKRRARRAEADQKRVFVWRFGRFPSGQVVDTSVIDATATDATVIDTSATDTTARLDERESDDPKSE